MVTIDIMALANDFILESSQPLVVRMEIARGFIKAAVEYVNTRDKEKRETIEENIYAYGEDNFGMVAPDKVFISYVARIQRMIRAAGWDPRIVVTLAHKEVGLAYVTATLQMDLEATATKLGWDMSPAPAEKESIMEVITDQPSMDEINEFNRSHDSGSGIRSPLLSDRKPKFVRKDQRRNIATHRR